MTACRSRRDELCGLLVVTTRTPALGADASSMGLPEQAVLALPKEVLRALSDDFIETLPEPTRATIRQRLGR